MLTYVGPLGPVGSQLTGATEGMVSGGVAWAVVLAALVLACSALWVLNNHLSGGFVLTKHGRRHGGTFRAVAAVAR